jgi:hypothetical protein
MSKLIPKGLYVHASPDPLITKDDIYNREWVHPYALRYYLYEDKDGWAVCDRYCDLAPAGTHPTKKKALKAFLKAVEKWEGDDERMGRTLRERPHHVVMDAREGKPSLDSYILKDYIVLPTEGPDIAP